MELFLLIANYNFYIKYSHKTCRFIRSDEGCPTPLLAVHTYTPWSALNSLYYSDEGCPTPLLAVHTFTPWSALNSLYSESENVIIKRRAVNEYYQNVNSSSPYNVPSSGFKSAINIRQMHFMNPLKPTSRCESYGRT